MGGFLSPPKTPAAPAPPPPMPSKSDEEIRGAELAERKRRAAAKGRSSTILTGGLGAAEEGPAGGKKTLLGG